MQDINAIRYENLIILLQAAGTQERLSQMCEVSNVYLNQIIRKRLDPATGKRRNVGDKLARMLEKGMSKPEGWMDTVHAATSSSDQAAGDRWPFQKLKQSKISKLSEHDLGLLEAAIILSAKSLGLDVH